MYVYAVVILLQAFDVDSSGSKEYNLGKPAAISYLYSEPTASDTLHCCTHESSILCIHITSFLVVH